MSYSIGFIFLMGIIFYLANHVNSTSSQTRISVLRNKHLVVAASEVTTIK